MLKLQQILMPNLEWEELVNFDENQDISPLADNQTGIYHNLKVDEATVAVVSGETQTDLRLDLLMKLLGIMILICLLFLFIITTTK